MCVSNIILERNMDLTREAESVLDDAGGLKMIFRMQFIGSPLTAHHKTIDVLVPN
jgi:hypothetical protein